ncbi:MAG: dihydropteroate synthase [Planctomycetota bacterium]|nr:dihydropteroate synthase [Planctomycetota bacterium]
MGSRRSLKIAGGTLSLGDGPSVFGILNVTPDSFFDGGLHETPRKAVDAALRMQAAGADVIDVGGQSTRPGSVSVAADEELRRVIPVLEALRGRLEIPLSIDTSREEVARAALEAGAGIINDVSGLRESPGMAGLAAERGAAVIIMHMRGTPRDMQRSPIHYEDVVGEIREFFEERVAFALRSGVAEDGIVLDPGIGFGKGLEDNLNVLCHIGEFRRLGYPVLVGPSRKSFIEKIAGAPVEERMPGTAAVVALCVAAGVEMIRVHDVAEMKQAAQVAAAICRIGGGKRGKEA